MINRETIERLRKEYPQGATVELLEMNDSYCKMPAGLRGVVDLVDDAGGIHVNWQNGSSLAAIPGLIELGALGSAPAAGRSTATFPPSAVPDWAKYARLAG